MIKAYTAEDAACCLLVGMVGLLVNLLGFASGEKAFHDGVVVAIALTAQALGGLMAS
jgi:hypothetical protein